jgi:hypothetical protein
MCCRIRILLTAFVSAANSLRLTSSARSLPHTHEHLAESRLSSLHLNVFISVWMVAHSENALAAGAALRGNIGSGLPGPGYQRTSCPTADLGPWCYTGSCFYRNILLGGVHQETHGER